jgi:hypothetical protein
MVVSLFHPGSSSAAAALIVAAAEPSLKLNYAVFLMK